MWQDEAMIQEKKEREIRQRVEAAARRLGGAERPDPGIVREVVQELDRGLEELGREAELAPELAPLVRLTVLQSAFPVLLGYRHGAPELAWYLLSTEWERVVIALGARRRWGSSEVREPGLHGAASMPLPDPAADRELLGIFNLVVFELLRAGEVQGRGQETARRLMTRLSLSYDQLGRAFGVSGETVRRWERGSHPIPDERLADLGRADAALGRLEGLFQPERLSQVVRRKAGLFGGEAALDWILRGKIGETADRYETALTYQG
jgi:transcriptional regulator with XRE-family HTH domain